MIASLDLSPLRVVAERTFRHAFGPFDLSLQGRVGVRAVRGGPDGIAVRLAEVTGGAHVEILAAGHADEVAVEQAFTVARGLGGLDDDPRGFEKLARHHPLVTQLYKRFPGARLRITPTVFESFVGAVIGQLVTAKEAILSVRRLHRRHGEEIPRTSLRVFPTAKAIGAVPAFELRAMGVGIRRASTLLAAAKLGERFETLREIPIERAMKWLDDLRGVGPWTSNKVAIEALGYADGVMVGDVGLPRTVTYAMTGREGGDAEMLECLEPFRPHRARVVRLLMLGDTVGGGLPRVPPRRTPGVDRHRRYPWKY